MILGGSGHAGASEDGDEAATELLAESWPEHPADVHLGPLVQKPSSLSRGSAARFIADGAGVASSLLAAIMSARALGPTGKGLFSSLTFLATMHMHIFSMGLGDAAVLFVNQRRQTLQRALGATLAAGLVLWTIGAAALWFSSMVAFSNDWAEVRGAVVITCASVPLFLAAYQLSFILIAQGRVPASSGVLATINLCTTLGIGLFMIAVPLGLSGGALGSVVGAACGLAVAAALVRRTGLSLRPRWDTGYLRGAVRYGAPVGLSYLVSTLAARTDLLLVYVIAGTGAAGQYSIGLTAATLVGIAPVAILNATFPRIASLDGTDADEMIAQSCRFSIALTVLGAGVLALAVPVAVPLLFGRDFLPGVSSALILLPSGVLWSSQWALCRGWAARGRPGLLVSSFGVSLVMMVALDYLLIPHLGITGAAVAANLAFLLGVVVCLMTYRRSSSWSLPLSRLLPRPSDLHLLAAQGLDLLRPIRRVHT